MDLLTGLTAISLGAYLVLLGAASPLLLLLLLMKRRRPEPPMTADESSPALLYTLRLVGFATLSFLALSLGILSYLSFVNARQETAPAPSFVARPQSFQHPLEAVEFESEPGVVLQGWLIPPRNGAIVILLHGYGGDRRGMIWHAQTLADAGFGVLLYDQRASGESGGERRSYGWEDVPDVTAALDFLGSHARTGEARLGVAGCSVGAQIAIRAAAEMPALEALWADGPAIVSSADLPPPHNRETTVLHALSRLSDLTFSARIRMLPPQPLTEQIGRIPARPLMLVAGGRGDGPFGPEERQVRHVARHGGAGTELWVIEDAVHCDGPRVSPDRYRERMVAFFQEHLLNR